MDDSERFKPHATREMANMFDDVSGRYDLLNRIMTLGQDVAWRRAMWRAVPEDAHVVLDLCTGSGASLTGLRRPGRLVLGIDVSLRMLERAANAHGTAGWAPRVVCADAFRLPLPGASLDAVTIGFGIRNLRPNDRALAELARVLRPAGTLVVLEAAAPGPGPLAAIHAFYLRRLIPLAGRLSSDPSAYVYLSRSILDFGSGPPFERALAAAGFGRVTGRSFMLGASRLWVARKELAGGEKAAGLPALMQNARPQVPGRGESPQPGAGVEAERRAWGAAQLATSALLSVALACGFWAFLKSSADLPLEPWQRLAFGVSLAAGTLGFALRTLILLMRFPRAPRRP